jgi:RecB family exonuclease
MTYMPTTLNIKDILTQVRGLDKEDQFTLLERLVALVRKQDEPSNQSSLLSLSGIGSDLWRETNIDQYIDEERQW